MLSDPEQRRLVEIERSLMAEAPRLARRFDRCGRHRRSSMIAATLLAVVGTCWITLLLALISGSVVIGILALIAMAVALGVWVARRRR